MQLLLELNDLLCGALRLAIAILRRLELDEDVQADLASVIVVLKQEQQDALVLAENILENTARRSKRRQAC